MHGHQLAGIHFVSENKPHDNIKNDLAEGIDHGPLYEAYTSNSFYFRKFKSKYFIGILIQSFYFLLGEPEAFNQFNIPEWFCSWASQCGCLSYDVFEWILFFTEFVGDQGQYGNANQVCDWNTPVDEQCRIGKNKYNPNENTKKYVDEADHKFFYICPDFS